MNLAAEKLSSIRHYCFVRGIAGQHPDPDFKQAFRTVNRLFVEARYDIASKRHSGKGKPAATRIRKAA